MVDLPRAFALAWGRAAAHRHRPQLATRDPTARSNQTTPGAAPPRPGL